MQPLSLARHTLVLCACADPFFCALGAQPLSLARHTLVLRACADPFFCALGAQPDVEQALLRSLLGLPAGPTELPAHILHEITPGLVSFAPDENKKNGEEEEEGEGADKGPRQRPFPKASRSVCEGGGRGGEGRTAGSARSLPCAAPHSHTFQGHAAIHLHAIPSLNVWCQLVGALLA